MSGVQLAQAVRRLFLGERSWFELQLRPEDALRRYGIPLPALPPDEVQIGFTAKAGLPNLQEAFSFYRYVSATCKLRRVRRPRILDFGAGWGRISRFFLKDTAPERVYVADCMSVAVHWMRLTRNPCRILQNEPAPPIAGLEGPLDLVYAFSVFSHLSEEYFRRWVDYLMALLRPGGHLVFTTRGHQFMDFLEQLQQEDGLPGGLLQEHYRRLREGTPPAAEVRRRHLGGEFQFYAVGGAEELTTDFFGEAFIPRSYLERTYGPALLDFTEALPHVEQAVAVLRKR